jgi:hypothetical protein
MEELNNISKKNHFKIPDNYFEELNERILSKTVNSDIGLKKRSIKKPAGLFLKIAAILTGVALISYFTIRYLTPDIDRNTLSGITLDEYTEVYSIDIDESVLEESLLEKEPTLSIDVRKSDIINYLQGEDLDYSDIYKLL